ncbi:MAG: helix-turn-helix transcriptional regulator [Nitrospirota bacterium]|jgi:transcriptional regulator with XRE-family HTH domain
MSVAAVRYESEESVGSLIRRLRKASGLSQKALSEKIGVSYQQVQKYEYGTSRITVDRLRQLAWALGVPVDVFMTDNGDPGLPRDPEEARLLELFRELKQESLRKGAIAVLDAMCDLGSRGKSA